MDAKLKQDVIRQLHDGGYSCVIACGDRVVTCHERGVKDLLRLLDDDPELLRGAFVADKVVGKGAAALMIMGCVACVYADVISRPARDLFAVAGIEVEWGTCVQNIINRAGTGICPVETLCMPCKEAEECLPLIRQFVSAITSR